MLVVSPLAQDCHELAFSHRHTFLYSRENLKTSQENYTANEEEHNKRGEQWVGQNTSIIVYRYVLREYHHVGLKHPRNLEETTTCLQLISQGTMKVAFVAGQNGWSYASETFTILPYPHASCSSLFSPFALLAMLLVSSPLLFVLSSPSIGPPPPPALTTSPSRRSGRRPKPLGRMATCFLEAYGEGSDIAYADITCSVW